MINIPAKHILQIKLLRESEARDLHKQILREEHDNSYWLENKAYQNDKVQDVVPDFKGGANILHTGAYVTAPLGVRPVLICFMNYVNSLNLNYYDQVSILGWQWFYIGGDKFLCKSSIAEMPFNDSIDKGNNFNGSDIQKFLTDWLQTQIERHSYCKAIAYSIDNKIIAKEKLQFDDVADWVYDQFSKNDAEEIEIINKDNLKDIILKRKDFVED